MIIETENQDDTDKGLVSQTRKPSASFYKHFTSLLRVQSNVTDLCEVKNNLQLPDLQSKSNLPFTSKASTLSKRRHSDQVSEVSPSTLRSYLLSNTAIEQYEIATNRRNFSDVKRRIDASLLKGRNYSLSHAQTLLNQNSSAYLIQDQENEYKRSLFSVRHNSVTSRKIQNNIHESRRQFASSNLNNGHQDFDSKQKWLDVVSKLNSETKVLASKQDLYLEEIPRLNLSLGKNNIRRVPELEGEAALKQKLSERDQNLIQKYRSINRGLSLSPEARRDAFIINLQNSQSKLEQVSDQKVNRVKNSKQAFNHQEKQEDTQILDALAQPIADGTGKALKLLEYQRNDDAARDNVAFAQKDFRDKLFKANDRMLDLIHNQVQDCKKIWTLLDYQQKLQQNPKTRKAGFEQLEKVKEIYIKDQLDQELKRKKRQGMDDTSKNQTSTVMSITQRDTTTNFNRSNTFQDQNSPLSAGKSFVEEQTPQPESSSFADQTPRNNGALPLIFDTTPAIFDQQTENDYRSVKQRAGDYSKFRTSKNQSHDSQRSNSPVENSQKVSPKQSSKGKSLLSTLNKLPKPSINSSKVSSPKRQKSSMSRLEVSGKVTVKAHNPNSKRAQSAESQQPTKQSEYKILVDVSKIKEELLDETPGNNQTISKNKSKRQTKLPFTIFFKAIELGVSTDKILTENPPRNFKDFYQQHFSSGLSFESESIRSDSSFEDVHQFEYEIPIEEQSQLDESSTSKSEHQDDLKEVESPSRTKKIKAIHKISKKPNNPYFRVNEKSYVKMMSKNAKMQKFVKENKENPQSNLSAFAILQQISRGRLVLKGLKFQNGELQALVNICISFKVNIKIVVIDKCTVADSDLRTAIASLSVFSQLSELALRDLHIGTLTILSLFRIQKKLPGLTLNISRCSFSNNFNMGVEKLIAPSILPLKNLSLRDSYLNDSHLDILSSRVQQMHHLDISLNQFSGSSILYFIQTVASSRMNSLSIAGNSLQTDQPQKMKECLKTIIQSKWMQHLDLTDTGLDVETVEQLAHALNQANTLISIHFSGTQEIRKAIHKVLGNLIQNRMGFHSSSDSISEDWFQKPNIPHLTHDDISGQVCNVLVQSPKYVLSRFIGRKDIQNNFDLRGDEYRVPEDILRQGDPILREAEIRAIQVQRCWMESDSCWVCQRWSYCVPLITRHEIDDSFPGEHQTQYTLNPVRARVLDRLIEKERQAYDSMELKEAYIIGEMTGLKFIKMDQMPQYMLKLDSNASQVLADIKGGKSGDLHKYYLPRFKTLFKQDQTLGRKIKAKQNQAKDRFGLAPYTPHLAQLEYMDVEEYTMYSQIWVHSCMMKPGYQEFFVVYKFDDHRVFKTQMSTVNPIRNFSIHNCKYLLLQSKLDSIPVMRRHKKHEEHPNSEAFSVFNNWKSETQKSLIFTFENDVKMWQLPGDKGEIQGLRTQDDPDEYQSLLKRMYQKLGLLQMSYKYLLSRSNTYPLLNYMQIQDWVTNDLKIIKPPELTKKKFDSVYRDCKQFSMQREELSTDSKLTKKEQRRKASMRFASKRDLAVNKLPDNQLTRYMFYELIVRIACVKLGLANKSQQSGQTQTPSKCFELFAQDILSPWLQRTMKWDHNVQGADLFIQKEVLTNTLVQRLMFQNQFVLQKIYDRMLGLSGDARETNVRPYQGEQPVKQKQEENQDHRDEEVKVDETPKFMKDQQPDLSLRSSKLRGSLKSMKTLNKKNLKLVVKREFLNLGPPVVGLKYKYLYQRLLEIKSDDISHHMNSKNFQYFLVFSKMTINHSNNQRLLIMQDLERYDRLFFSEFLMLLCFLANECFQLVRVNEEPISFVQRLSLLLQKIIEHFKEEYKKPDLYSEAEIAGIDKIERIYLNSEIRTFVPPTPVSQRKSHYEAEINSNYAEFEQEISDSDY